MTTQKIYLAEVIRVVVIRCSDPHGIHAGQPYIRYLVLVHKERAGGEVEEHYEGVWINDPSQETCLKIYKGLPKTAIFQEVSAQCQWCVAQSSK
jgi:hypothetical protein